MLQKTPFIQALSQAILEELAQDGRLICFEEADATPSPEQKELDEEIWIKFGENRCLHAPIEETKQLQKSNLLITFPNISEPPIDKLQQILTHCPSPVIRLITTFDQPALAEILHHHFPQLALIYPTNSADAKGLLKSAIRHDAPSCFLENPSLYSKKSPLPQNHAFTEGEFLIPLPKADITREGTELTLITYGKKLFKALRLADELQTKHRLSSEVIDLRCLYPFDLETCAQSLKKTNRALIFDTSKHFSGLTATIAAQLQQNAFDHLDAPIQHLCSTQPIDKIIKQIRQGI